MNTVGGSALTVDFSSSRRQIFKTASALGTFRHDNAAVIKIDVEDFDPLQADLEYTIQYHKLKFKNYNNNRDVLYKYLRNFALQLLLS